MVTKLAIWHSIFTQGSKMSELTNYVLQLTNLHTSYTQKVLLDNYRVPN